MPIPLRPVPIERALLRSTATKKRLLRFSNAAEGGTVSSTTAAKVLLILATLCILGMRPSFIFCSVLN
jgi:hypothetical protein